MRYETARRKLDHATCLRRSTWRNGWRVVRLAPRIIVTVYSGKIETNTQPTKRYLPTDEDRFAEDWIIEK